MIVDILHAGGTPRNARSHGTTGSTAARSPTTTILATRAGSRLSVPEILGDVDSGWALPVPRRTPATGAGIFTIPAVGAGVWVEFEAGDVSRPIWGGGWWASGKQPQDEGGTGAKPDVRIIRGESGHAHRLPRLRQRPGPERLGWQQPAQDRLAGRQGPDRGLDEGRRSRRPRSSWSTQRRTLSSSAIRCSSTSTPW